METGFVLWSNGVRYWFPYSLGFNQLTFGSPDNKTEVGKFIRKLIEADDNAQWKYFENNVSSDGVKAEDWKT